MTGEEYLARLGEIVAKHPGAAVIAYDRGDDFTEGSEFPAAPYWSERDQVIYADGEGDEPGLGPIFRDVERRWCPELGGSPMQRGPW